MVYVELLGRMIGWCAYFCNRMKAEGTPVRLKLSGVQGHHRTTHDVVMKQRSQDSSAWIGHRSKCSLSHGKTLKYVQEH
jgi:hypothetical protein